MVHKQCWYRSWVCLSSTVLSEFGSKSLRSLTILQTAFGWKGLVLGTWFKNHCFPLEPMKEMDLPIHNFPEGVWTLTCLFLLGCCA